MATGAPTADGSPVADGSPTDGCRPITDRLLT